MKLKRTATLALAAALAAGAGIFFYMRRWIRRRS